MCSSTARAGTIWTVARATRLGSRSPGEGLGVRLPPVWRAMAELTPQNGEPDGGGSQASPPPQPTAGRRGEIGRAARRGLRSQTQDGARPEHAECRFAVGASTELRRCFCVGFDPPSITTSAPADGGVGPAPGRSWRTSATGSKRPQRRRARRWGPGDASRKSVVEGPYRRRRTRSTGPRTTPT